VNYKRWIIVGLVATLAVFSFFHLSTAGSDYEVLTTSDSGYFYGIARDMHEEGGMIDYYELSHPPEGNDVRGGHQFQPLVLVTMYRGLSAIRPDITLLEVQKYFSPFIFAITVIGAFLVGKELGGDVAGGASALFFTTMVGSIYWTKIGAFDRRTLQLFFGVWLFYAMVRVLKSEGSDLVKNVAFAGILYGMFLLTWPGALFIGAITVAALFLVIAERIMDGLGFTVTGIGFIAMGTQFAGIGMVELLGAGTLLAGLFRLARNWEEIEKIEGRLVSTFKDGTNLRIIGAVIGVLGVSTLLAVGMGEYGPGVWSNFFTDTIGGFVGVGEANGATFPIIATEMRAISNELPTYFAEALDGNLYRNATLTGVTGLLVILAVGKMFKSAKAPEMFALSYMLITMPMVLDQARFGRAFWNWWPILAGVGFGVLVMVLKDMTPSVAINFSKWLDRLRHPLVLALICLLIAVPFLQNARADRHASEVRPVPHGGSLPGESYHSLLNSFNWIRENTDPDATVAIPWSYGHFVTGAAERRSVTDGAHTTGWRDEWRDDRNPPPDYIQYVVGDEGYRIGVNTEASKYEINGRRPDVRNLVETGDEDYFRWIVNSYREEFDIRMDYVVFNEMDRERSIMGMLTDPEFTEDFTRDQVGFTFEFEEGNVFADLEEAPVTGDNEGLAGFVIYDVQMERLLNYSFAEEFEKSELLWVITAQQEVVQAGLDSFEGVPMTIRALDNYETPDFLTEAHREPRAAVYMVDHDLAFEGGVPTPEGPTDDATVDGTPELSWTPSGGSARYELAIDDDPEFSDPMVWDDLSEEEFEIPSEDALPDGRYYWRVRAFTAAGETAGWSDAATFTVSSGDQ